MAYGMMDAVVSQLPHSVCNCCVLRLTKLPRQRSPGPPLPSEPETTEVAPRDRADIPHATGSHVLGDSCGEQPCPPHELPSQALSWEKTQPPRRRTSCDYPIADMQYLCRGSL